MILDYLAVGFGGFLGSVCRYAVGLLPLKSAGFPYKTLAINLLGAFVIGWIAALAAKNKALDPRLILMLKVGVCGGFTTFSTFAYETLGLLAQGQTAAALGYVLASVVLGVLAVFGAQALVG